MSAFGRRLFEAHRHILRYAGVGSLAVGVTQFGRATLDAADANVDLRNRLRRHLIHFDGDKFLDPIVPDKEGGT